VGRLHVVYRGVYAVGHVALRVEGRFVATVLASGPGAVLSHRSAAAHWGLLAALNAKSMSRRRRHDTACARSACTGPVPSMPVTPRHTKASGSRPSPARCWTWPPPPGPTAWSAYAQALHLHLYDQRAIADILQRANGHRGTRALAQATAREPKLTRSHWEIRKLTLIRNNGLPEPLVNHALIAPDHGHCEVDFYWPAQRLIVETDSWSAHGTRAAFASDRARDAALTAAGHRVVRFAWHTNDATIPRRLRALLH
jgi:very-short-patch-repair endonuclease